MSNFESARGTAPPLIDHDGASTEQRDGEPDRETVLSLVNDEYAHDILSALGNRPLAARELIERLDASRATVYRRLNKLESAGIVESSMSIHPEGYHRKKFRMCVEGVHLRFGADGVSVEISS
jgi:DNA-binding transcriptional ArsR family regulator